MRSAAIVVTLLVLQPQFAVAQRVAETLEVTVIEVPVVVTRNGEAVRGLTAENFEIYDQGRKRPITHFEMVDRSRPSASRSETSVSAQRTFMLLFDLSNSSPTSLSRAREAAKQFVASQVLPKDRVAVATSSVQSGFQLLTAFTTDRALIASAITTLGGPRFFDTTDPLRLASTLTETEDRSVVEARPDRNVLTADSRTRDVAALQQRVSNEAQKQIIKRQLDQFADLGRLLDRVRGRKQVILLSDGFDPRLVHGRFDLNSPEQREEQASVERGEIWRVDTDNRYGGSETVAALRRMIDTLRRSDVVLHAIDLRGLRSSVDPSEGAKLVSNESLYLLTRDTGGTVFKNSNDLSAQFERMMKAQEITYVLGFRASAGSPGAFHELKVKLTGVPDAEVTHRAGYYQPSAASSELDRLVSAGEIVVNSIPVDTIVVRALAAAVPSGSGPAHVAVVLEIDGQSLLAGAAGRALPLEAFIYAFDLDEIIRDYTVQRMTIDVAKLGARLKKKGVKFYDTLRLPPGEYSLRVLVRGAGKERTGFYRIPFYVPQPGEAFVMQPLLVDDTRDWIMVKAPDHDPEFPYPFQAGTDTFIPALRPVLSRSEAYTIGLFSYNMPADVVVKAFVEGAAAQNGERLSFLGRAPDSSGAVKLMYEFKPLDLTPGDYSLVMSVGDGQRTESRFKLRFAVN